MSAYLSRDQLIAPEHPAQGAWVWVPFPSTSNPCGSLEDQANQQATFELQFLEPAPMPEFDAAFFDDIDLPLADPLVQFPEILDSLQGPGGDMLELGYPRHSDRSAEPAAFFDDALDSFLSAELDRQLAEMAWEDLVHTTAQPPELVRGVPAATPSDSTLTPATSCSPSSCRPSPPASPATPPPPASGLPQPPTSRVASPFTCPDDSCSKSFPNLHLLRKHERQHTRPFVCAVCAKGHAAKKDLHRHLWARHRAFAAAAGVPSDVRRCPAPGCGFEGRQDNLARHVRTKHR